MITLDVQTDIAQALKKFYALEPRQFPFIVSLAMNRTMQQIKKNEQQEISRAFDRPTPFTMNSLQITPATKDNLQASIGLRDFAGKGTPASKYLAPEIYGGDRRYKRFELALKSAGILPDGMFAVPGKGAALDQYGNMTASYITRILSYLRASPDATQNRARRGKAKALQFFAVSRPNDRSLPLGIYERTGNTIRLVIAFVKQPLYRERFKFYDVAGQSTQQLLADELRKAAEYAISTSNTSLTLSDFTSLLNF